MMVRTFCSNPKPVVDIRILLLNIIICCEQMMATQTQILQSYFGNKMRANCNKNKLINNSN